MDSRLSYRICIAIKVCVLLALGLSVAPAARGQELVTDLTAPPPMKFVSRNEQAQLSAMNEPKERTRVSLELAEGHLRHAEDATFTRSYDPASGALGRYQAVIEDALRYLSGLNRENKKTRDLFKRMEITLRAHMIRIETIRRDTPFEHAVNVKTVLDSVRNARTRALNIFYSDTVVREVLQETGKPSDDERPKDSSSSQQKNPL
jgi:hypothetical protein